MKPLFIFLGSIFLSSDPACSQDTINMRSGITIPSKILMINDQNVIYKKYSNLNGPDYSFPKTDVITIKYENGTIDFFSVNSQEETTNALPRNEYYFIKRSGGCY